MSRMSLPVKSRRLNLRVLIALGVVVLTSVVGFVALKAYRDRRATPALLGEAKKYWELKQHSLALGYLNRYLELHPDDLDALDLKAKFLAESTQDARQAMEAMPIHNQVLGRDPQRQETRRRLLELNLKVPGRAKTAVTLARELIRRGDGGPRAHRLLARALEQSGAEGDNYALAEACREYEAAEKHDPGDVEGGEWLARLYQEKLHDPEKGQQVLDKLLALNQAEHARRAAVRLAQARYCARLGQIGRAGAEIDQAIRDDPGDPEIRIVAAQLAAQRGDTANARRHLAAIPDAARNDLRIKLIEGVIDLKERRPNEAAQSWRSGLLLTGGSNIELTWRLAQILLEMGRVSEAEPLIAQYRRLAGSEEPNAWYHYLHALSLFKTGRPDEAAQELEAIRFKADKLLETSLYLLLGQCYEAARDESQALAAFRRTTELSHDLADPWLAIARLQWPRQPNAAIDTIALGLKAIPADPRLLAMSIHYQWQRQTQRPSAERSWDGVERALSRADQIAPGSLEVALVRSEYLQSLGKNEDSLDLLEEVTKRFPKYVPLWAIRARALSRLGRTSDALKLLDQATEAAGPQALLAIDRASILLAQGHVKEAHATLRNALGRVPAEQRPALWKALGEYYAAQSDLAAARDAYQEYSRLEPNNPEPRILLLDLALTAGDDAAIRIEVSALKAFGGPNSLYWRLARVRELLRDRPQGKAEPAEEASRLEEAERLVQEIKKSEPQSPLGYLLEGRLRERRHETNRAVAAYERAVDRNGGQLALAPLVALLVRERRDADLKRLRQKLATLPVELERLATLQALKLGDKDRAEQLAARMAEGHPEALDVQVWQAQVLKALGKPEAAEAALLRLIRQRPAEPSPWLQLLMLQVSQKRLKDAAETVEQLRNERPGRPPRAALGAVLPRRGRLPPRRGVLPRGDPEMARRSGGARLGGQLLRADRPPGRGRGHAARDPGSRPRTRLGGAKARRAPGGAPQRPRGLGQGAAPDRPGSEAGRHPRRPPDPRPRVRPGAGAAPPPGGPQDPGAARHRAA